MKLPFAIVLLVVACNAAGAQPPLQFPANLSGRIITAGKSGLDVQHLSVQLLPEDGDGPDVMADVAKDGTFGLTELRDTTYRLRVKGLPDGWYMLSAVLNGRNVLNQGLKLSAGDAGQHLEITVSPGAAKVQGVVLERVFREPVPRGVVELFPDPANPHRADLFRSASTDETGRFVIKNIVPGKYRVIAFMGKPPSEPSYDDSVIAASAGIRVTLAEKQSKNLELGLFEAHR